MADGQTNDQPATFAEVTERLEEIVAVVRDKDLPLERSLDLFEEAVSLSNRAVELVAEADLDRSPASDSTSAQQSQGTSPDEHGDTPER